MLAEERFSLIMEQLNRKRTVTVQELCEAMNTSESTIRRDLTELDRLGKLNKVHGVPPCRTAVFWRMNPPWRPRSRRLWSRSAASRRRRQSSSTPMILCSSMQAPPRWSWCVHWRGMPSKPAM